MALARTTELEAVNVMLGTIGEAPVNSLSPLNVADVTVAKNVLDEIRREVLTEGYQFNTEHDVPMSPDQDGNVSVPDNALKITLTTPRANLMDVVQRGNKLYDRRNHTFTFTTTLKASIIYLLEWDDLPEAARLYIKIRAARTFCQRQIGSTALVSFTASDEFAALAKMKQADDDNAAYSIFDTYDTASIGLRRRSPRQ